MELTGKCKELFEKWLAMDEAFFDFAIENDDDTGIPTYEGRYFHYVEFDYFPESMKFGVYVDFFDFLQMQIYIKPTMSHKWSVYIDDFGHHILTDYLTAETLQKARTEAIKKANEIINKN